MNKPRIGVKPRLSLVTASSHPDVGPTSLMGRFSSPVAKPVSQSSRGALGRVRAAAGSDLAARRERVEAQHAADREERMRQAMERIVQDKIEDTVKDYSVRLAVVLDYTASTIGDVASFRDDMGKLVRILKGKIDRLDILPVASRGGRGGADVVVGDVNDMDFLKGVENVAHTYHSPIGPGLDKVMDGDFFKGRPADVEAICYVADNEFERYASGTGPQILERRVAVAGLLTASWHQESHERNVVDAFGEQGVVVLRNEGEADPIETVAQFILNRAYNKARPLAVAAVPNVSAIQAAPLRASLSFAEHLKIAGVNPGRVIQGREPRLLTG